MMWRIMRMAALAAAVTAGLSGLALAQGGYYRSYDRDSYDRDSYDRDSHDRGDYRHDWDDRGGFRAARNLGYEDGSYVAREDISRGKPFNPYPRGRYAHRDHGYRHQYGDRDEYQEQYERAYRQGYERMFRRY